MTNLFQIRCLYTGRSGLPGTNTMYGSEGDIAVSEMRDQLAAFYGEWAADHMSNAITVTIPNSGDIIDSNNGDLLSVWNSGDAVAITGANADSPCPTASQVLVQLKTSDVVAGRKLHGRVFLPGVCRSDSPDGKPGSSLISSVADAAADCFSNPGGPNFAVYSPTHHTWASVNGVGVWDQFAVLRSRRD